MDFLLHTLQSDKIVSRSVEATIATLKERYAAMGSRYAAVVYNQDKIDWQACGLYKLSEGQVHNLEGSCKEVPFKIEGE
eukprot:10886237-Prorocentrum_lima.AAC.1